MSDWHTKKRIRKRGGSGMKARGFMNVLDVLLTKGGSMNDLRRIMEANGIATLREYRQALLDGAYVKAQRIEVANPDLAAQFAAIRADMPAEV